MKDIEALRVRHQQEAIISLRAKGEEKVALESGQIWSSLRGAIGVEHHSDQERHSYSGGRAENKAWHLSPPALSLEGVVSLSVEQSWEGLWIGLEGKQSN